MNENKIDENKMDYLSISQVAHYLGVANATIQRWYKWFENDDYEKPEGLNLPKYRHLDGRKTKFFHKDSLATLEDFKEKITKAPYRGALSKFHRDHSWSWDKKGE